MTAKTGDLTRREASIVKFLGKWVRDKLSASEVATRAHVAAEIKASEERILLQVENRFLKAQLSALTTNAEDHTR